MKNLALVFGLVLFAVISRLFIFEPNLSAFGAVAFLIGYYLWSSDTESAPTSRFMLRGFPVLSVILFFSGLLISDLALGVHSLMPTVYGAFLVYFLVGWILNSRSNFASMNTSSFEMATSSTISNFGLVTGGSFLSSFVFFLTTNFAVWAEGLMYSKDLAGLMQCYIAGIPFYRGQLLGDIGFTLVGFALVEIYKRSVHLVRA